MEDPFLHMCVLGKWGFVYGFGGVIKDEVILEEKARRKYSKHFRSFMSAC